MRRVLGSLVLVFALLPTRASAVTYGDFVDSPQITYPEVVPVWTGGSLCTGTLIEQQIVLTAAHCVYGKPGPIQVAVGGSTLNSGKLIDVTATWYHPRYDAAFIQNDIALLYLKEAARVSQLASLPSPTAAKPKNFTLAGWGHDQNRRLTGNLSAINLNDHSTVAAKVFRRSYNPRTMIGAGRYFADEDLYGGGCEGDSGGPLYKGRNGSTRIVMGVTSWGAEGCVRYKPTVFTLVGYYVPELLVAITAVKNRAVQSPLPTGRATPAGVGPTTTSTTTTTLRPSPPATTTTIRPSATTTTAIPQSSTSTTTPPITTTTTRPIASLGVSLSHSKPTCCRSGTDVEIAISTDVTARIARFCLSITSDGSAWPWFNMDFSPDYPDVGGGCRGYVGRTSWSGGYYISREIQEKVGVQSWTATITVTDSLGRSANATYSWNS